MPTKTFYYRSDTHTINGLNAYQLKESNSSSTATLETGGTDTAYWKSDVIIRHSDGSETTIGSNVAEVYRDGESYEYSSNTWSCPETSVTETDAIKIVEKIYEWTTLKTTRNFITEQLGAIKIQAGTWTFTRWCEFEPYGEYNDVYYRLKHGSSTNETKVSDVDILTYVDIGLRVYNGSEIIQVACEPSGTLTSPLRVRKDTTTYGIVLVDTTDSNASKIRIETSSGIKAIAKL